MLSFSLRYKHMTIKCLQVEPIGTNCYLLEDPDTNRAAVVDPGGNAPEITAALAADGMELAAIFLTHAHYDHTGGVNGLRAAFPDVPVYLHPEDRALLGTSIYPDVAPTVDYDEGDELTVGTITVKVLHTPGHTPGGVTLMAGRVLFTGDTLFTGSMGRTDLPGGDDKAIMASLARLAGLEGDWSVLPGHMEGSTMARERLTNYFLREALA